MTIRSAEVTVKLRLTMPESYTGEIDNDIEQDVQYALHIDPDSTLADTELEVVDVTVNNVEDDDREPVADGDQDSQMRARDR